MHHCPQPAAPIGLSPLSAALSLTPSPPKVPVPIGLSPPSARDLPVSPILTSLHPLLFPFRPPVGCANGAPGLSRFHCSVSGPHGGGQWPSPLARAPRRAPHAASGESPLTAVGGERGGGVPPQSRVKPIPKARWSCGGPYRGISWKHSARLQTTAGPKTGGPCEAGQAFGHRSPLPDPHCLRARSHPPLPQKKRHSAEHRRHALSSQTAAFHHRVPAAWVAPATAGRRTHAIHQLHDPDCMDQPPPLCSSLIMTLPSVFLTSAVPPASR